MSSNPDAHADTLFIRDLETLRVVVDPMRGLILELLVQGPQTIKEVADKLGESPNKLYYHFGLLEKHALIQVAETRPVAHMLEKVYRASARSIQVDPSLITITNEECRVAMKSYITPVLDQTREDLVRSLQIRTQRFDPLSPPALHRMLISREVSHIPAERVAEFIERFQALVAEFLDANQGLPSTDSPNYALMLAFYPSFYYEVQESNKTD